MRKRPYDIERCKVCRYRGYLDYDTQLCCNYRGITGHSRLLLPKREDGLCPAFEEGEMEAPKVPPPMVGEPKEKPQPKRQSEKMLNRFKQFQDLYDQGMTDKEIGDEMSCSERSVSSWRRRAGLPGNGAKKKRYYDPEVFRKMYDMGYSDVRISLLTGYHHGVIANWRKLNGLPPTSNGGSPPKFDRGEMRRLYDQGMSDREIAQRMGCSSTVAMHWRKAEGLKANSRKKEDRK